MVNCLVRFPLTGGVQGGTLDAWLRAPSPFLDRDSPRCQSVRDEWALGGGRRPENHNRGSARIGDRDKSLARILTMQHCLKVLIRFSSYRSPCPSLFPCSSGLTELSHRRQ